MKKIKNILLSIVLVLGLCIGVTACDPKPQTYTLSFDMGGVGTQIESQVLVADVDVPVQPQDPVATGYKFDGWYSDSSYSFYFNFNNSISEDTVAYAKWIQCHTVTFETGIDGLTVNSQEVADGTKATLPTSSTMVAKGKKFEGWYTAPTGGTKVTSSTLVTSSVTYYARWSIYYQVKFDRNGTGSANKVPATQTYTAEGSKAVKPEDMSANSYVFDGWSITKDGSAGLYNFDTILTDSITLYAQWTRLYNVTFNVNNDEYLQDAPVRQSVKSGEYAEDPGELFMYGYDFDGWYTASTGGTKVDFENYPITAITTLYAHWTLTGPETLDVETPEYTFREEAPFGDRPDLEGYIIDGKMGEAEHWEDQNWYSTSITDAPTATMSITTQFSEKGLYLFIKVEDNGGLFFDGRNWRHKNSHVQFKISNGETTRDFYMDTLCLLSVYIKTKAAVHIAEGEVNTANSANKRAVMQIEMFTTWKELNMTGDEETVKIYAGYKYKRMMSENTTNNILAAPFATTSSFNEYNADGYVKIDAEDAVLGNSSYNIAKTEGWNITNESNREVVSGGGSNTQAIFFKDVTDTEYYQFEFDIDASSYSKEGKAGAIIYTSDTSYAKILFTVNGNFVKNGKFEQAELTFIRTNTGGTAVIKNVGKLAINNASEGFRVKIIFSNGYIYCIVNEALLYCENVPSLSVRTNPGVCTQDGAAGVKFKNYSAQILTATQAKAEASKYAYVISKGGFKNLSVELSTTAVSSQVGVSKEIEMTLQSSTVAYNPSQVAMIAQGIVPEVALNEIDELYFVVNGQKHDITPALTDPETGAKDGIFAYEYPFTADSQLNSTSREIPRENLTTIYGQMRDEKTGAVIGATATVYSNYPRMSMFNVTLTNGVVAIVVPKGYDYRIEINSTGYRKQVIEIENIQSHYEIADTLYFTANVLGGTARSKFTTFTRAGGGYDWDMTNEAEGEILFETTGGNPSTVWFSGYTISPYQYAKLSVSNVTDINAVSRYESDPAIGFVMRTAANDDMFIGLYNKGLRYLPDRAVWSPQHIQGLASQTVNKIDPTGNHKDTLEVIRIKRLMYCYVNGIYMGVIELPAAYDGEVAVGVSGTFSYYSKIIYKDYEMKAGNEALAIAKERLNLDFTYHDSMYKDGEALIEISDFYSVDIEEEIMQCQKCGAQWKGNPADYADFKPTCGHDKAEYIYVENTRGNYVDTQDLALAERKIKISLTEKAKEQNKIFTVSLGSYGTAVLSNSTDSILFTIPAPSKDPGATLSTAEVKVEPGQPTSISGKFVVHGTYSQAVQATAVLSSGAEIPFTAGADGSFTFEIPRGESFKIKYDDVRLISPPHSSEGKQYNFPSANIGNFDVYVTILGGTVEGTTHKSSVSGVTIGYDTDTNTIQEGEYVEINTEGLGGNKAVAINTGTYENFDLSFRMIRYTTSNNEQYPGFGVNLITSGTYDYAVFYENGVRFVYDEWGGGDISKKNLISGWSAQEVNPVTTTSLSKAIDLRIVRRDSVFVMFYKKTNETKWTRIWVGECRASGPSSIFLYSMNGSSTYNHTIFWNVKMEALTSTSEPEMMTIEPSINIVGESQESIDAADVRLVGGTKIDGQTKYIIGDTAKLQVSAKPGFICSSVKYNGAEVDLKNGEYNFVVDGPVDFELFYEPAFSVYDVTGKISIDTTYTDRNLPESVNIYAYYDEYRNYKLLNLPVASDGTVELSLRAGTFEIYAEANGLVSKKQTVTIDVNNKNIGNYKLEFYNTGKTIVNGNVLNNNPNPLNTQDLYTNGMMYLTGYNQERSYLPASPTKGNFVLYTELTQSSDPTSPAHTSDYVSGIVFANYWSTFAIYLYNNGFRIGPGWWDNTQMIEVFFKDKPYFFNRGTTSKVRLGVKKANGILSVYVNGELYFTFDSTNGFVPADGKEVEYDLNKSEEVIKRYKDTLDNDSYPEVSLGYGCNLAAGGNNVNMFNRTGYSSPIITQREASINAFDGTKESLMTIKTGGIKNVILMVGDGMGSEHIEAGELYEGKDYVWTNWLTTKIDTNCADREYTDSAAAATAMATGVVTNYNYVGKDPAGNNLETIADIAKAMGKKTGVVTSSLPYDATPSAFAAHMTNRYDTNAVAKSMLAGGLDLIAGHNAAYMGIESNADEIANNGYTFVNDFSKIGSSMSADKAVWTFNIEGKENYYDEGEEIALKDVAVNALNFLDNENGFFVMIENEHIDIYAEDNDIENTVKHVKSFNDTIEAVLAWMQATGHMEDTMLIVLADHETGGLTVDGTAGANSIDTLNGGKLYYSWTSGQHTNTDVDMFVYGAAPDFSEYSNFSIDSKIKNSNVFDIMKHVVNYGAVQYERA